MTVNEEDSSAFFTGLKLFSYFSPFSNFVQVSLNILGHGFNIL
jgi:hypothetical protein